jgi:hypothetical protein
MTLTDRSMEWLNQNRHRSYPMERDGWRERVSPTSGLDCVILDATVFDAAATGDNKLVVESISVSSSETTIVMSYSRRTFTVTLEGGDVSGDGSFEVFRGVVPGPGIRGASISLVMSSHAYIIEQTGEGSWSLGCEALKSRVVAISDGSGVDGMTTSGSEGVEGHGDESVASVDVVLEDGYRTSPVVMNGRVIVRVGKRFGYDPCKFDFGDAGSRDCRKPLFFFCGQNAINGGNIVLSGGRGVSVTQGRSYKVRSGTCKGKTVPCIEIVAGRDLVDICKAAE